MWLCSSAAALKCRIKCRKKRFPEINNYSISNLQYTDATMCLQIIQIRTQRKYTAQYNMHWTEEASTCLTRSDYVIKMNISIA